MSPLLLCHANEERDNVWIIQWLRRADLLPLLVVQAQDGGIIISGSVAYRLLSQHLNATAVNKCCDGPSILYWPRRGASKAEGDAFQPLDDRAIEKQPERITTYNTVCMVRQACNSTVWEREKGMTNKAVKGHPSVVRSSRMPCSRNRAL